MDKRRSGSAMSICEEFDLLYCKLTDTQVATVTSATKLENEQQFQIAKKLQELTGASQNQSELFIIFFPYLCTLRI